MTGLLVLHMHVHVASNIFISEWTNAFENFNVGTILGLEKNNAAFINRTCQCGCK